MPKGYSLHGATKNTRKNNKNSKNKNEFNSSIFKHENRRKKISNYDFSESDFNYKRCSQVLRLIKQHPLSKPFLYPVDPV